MEVIVNETPWFSSNEMTRTCGLVNDESREPRNFPKREPVICRRAATCSRGRYSPGRIAQPEIQDVRGMSVMPSVVAVVLSISANITFGGGSPTPEFRATRLSVPGPLIRSQERPESPSNTLF